MVRDDHYINQYIAPWLSNEELSKGFICFRLIFYTCNTFILSGIPVWCLAGPERYPSVTLGKYEAIFVKGDKKISH